ncbi:MAG: peptidase M42, partial [Anaerolineales bacterium]|nr:peptidase M42 [Anaerolineales bacterium]
TDIYPYYGSDGEALWRAGGNVAVALIGPGVDASHHYERTHREALEATAALIMAYLLS